MMKFLNLLISCFFLFHQKRYFTDDKSFEKYAETMELFRSTYLILKKNNDQLREQMKNVDVNQELLQVRYHIIITYKLKFLFK